MSAALAKFMNPAFYKQAWAKTVANAHTKYHPTIRENKATVLFHSMLGISFIMYTATYIGRKYPEVKHEREVKKAAIHEYCEKHGIHLHH